MTVYKIVLFIVLTILNNNPINLKKNYQNQVVKKITVSIPRLSNK